VSRKRKKAEAAASAAATPQPTPGSKQVWKLMDRSSSVASAVLARQVSERAWKLATGKRPPSEKTNLDPNLREIALWAFIGGGLAELVRVLVKRSTATYWVKSTGHLPPGMKKTTHGDPVDTPE
jgi:Protein of unknown function (DUF4235)